MKIKIYSLLIAFSMLLVSSCELDLLDDPNAVSRENADPNFIVNRLQIDLADFFNETSEVGMRLTRMLNQDENTYEAAYFPTEFDVIWNNAYANILNDVRTLTPIAEERGLTKHLGIARTIEAYVMMTLVDYFGDVPYSQAFDPENFNPSVDSGADIYNNALALLQQAKADFAAESASNPTDFYYNGDYTKWTRFVNTLMLKLHLTRKLVDPNAGAAINALLTEGNLIQEGDDFVFRYGRNQSDPDSRHPSFADNYTQTSDYMSNFYMWHLTEAKEIDDPRARYYFYRQVGSNPTDINKLRCITEFPPNHYQAGGFVFCLPGERGYWGRDHLDNQGIPPDNTERTTWGLYPAGGKFDDDSFSPVTPTSGNQGAGIQPIMLASYVDFMLAEAALTTGATGAPNEYLLAAIEKNMNTIRSFALSSLDAGAIEEFEAAEERDFQAEVDNYLERIAAEYAAATTETDKMRIIGREYWLALFGNGVEAYNLYRRTGTPAPLQPGLIPNFGLFPRSLVYPSSFVNRNNTVEQKANNNVRVFWDTNPVDGWIN